MILDPMVSSLKISKNCSIFFKSHGIFFSIGPVGPLGELGDPGEYGSVGEKGFRVRSLLLFNLIVIIVHVH